MKLQTIEYNIDLSKEEEIMVDIELSNIIGYAFRPSGYYIEIINSKRNTEIVKLTRRSFISMFEVLENLT